MLAVIMLWRAIAFGILQINWQCAECTEPCCARGLFGPSSVNHVWLKGDEDGEQS